MILDPINDRECLDQLTRFARELAPTTLIRAVAQRLGSREAVIRWFQSLPQADDDGAEQVRFIQCDVPQRVRLLPDDPNCVERSTGALMLLEVIDPQRPRALATVDKPLRHTGLVERYGAHWRAVDLFPRRNAGRYFDVGEFGKDLLQGLHRYVGKPILSFYGAGGIADALGKYEDKAIGRDNKQEPEKKGAPPSAQGRPQREQPSTQPRPQPVYSARVGTAAGAGAIPRQPTSNRGGGNDGKETQDRDAGAAARDRTAAASRTEAGDGDGRDSDGADARATPASKWWFLGY